MFFPGTHIYLARVIAIFKTLFGEFNKIDAVIFTQDFIIPG